MKTKQTRIVTGNYLSIRKEYFHEVFLPVFAKISRTITPVEKYYMIAGKSICIKFYNKTLAEHFSFALLHNEVPTQKKNDLTVHAFDSVSSGVSLASPWKKKIYRSSGEIDAKKILQEAFLGVYVQGEETLTLYDRTHRSAYFWTHDAELLPNWVSAAPFRTLLHWFLSESNTHLIHGAVIGRDENAVLLTAKGGSGKSTTALSCLLLGMTYLADDYVGIELADVITAHSLYSSVKAAPHKKIFQRLHKHIWKKEGAKDILFLAKLFPKQMRASAKLRAILIPVITNSKKTAIVPASKMQAMLALIPTTMFQLPLAETDKIETLKKIIERTPCYFLRLATDSLEAASSINNFLTSKP